MFFACITLSHLSQENCSNSIDDDNDGLIDLQDPDCICQSPFGGNSVNSLIPNPSFESFANCCPQNPSELFCADSWVQASDGTSDYYNDCGYIAPSIIQAGLHPFPDGNSAAGIIITPDYKEYIGSCLTSPMVAGESYTIQLQLGSFMMDPTGSSVVGGIDLSDLSLTFYGTSDCGNIPFSGEGCPPSASFIELGSTLVNFSNTYETISFTFTPAVNISGIILGAPCNVPVDYPNDWSMLPYFVIDNILINETSSFGQIILQDGKICTDDLKLFGNPTNSGGSFQWYKEGVALVGETTDTLFVSNLGLEDGLYQLRYTLNGSCYVDTLLVEPFIPFQVVANDTSICNGGTLTLIASGATSYQWSPSTFLSNTSGDSVVATPNASIQYTIVGFDDEGCLDSTSLNLNIFQIPIEVNSVSSCEKGEQLVLQASGAENYSWSPASGLNSTSGSQVLVTVDSTITYTVIGEINGCIGEAYSTITYQQDINFNVTTSPNTPTIFDPTVFISASSQEDLMYSWYFNGLSLMDTNNFNYTFSNQESELHILTVAVNQQGCIDSLWSTLNFLSPPFVYIPNTFSPNGDENNNDFSPIFSSNDVIEEYKLTIFNRWGELIYESHDINVGWDGTYNSKLAPTEIYVWKVVYKEATNPSKVLGGHLYLLK
jgi:gliding motility-associated-like protein